MVEVRRGRGGGGGVQQQVGPYLSLIKGPGKKTYRWKNVHEPSAGLSVGRGLVHKCLWCMPSRLT